MLVCSLIDPIALTLKGSRKVGEVCIFPIMFCDSIFVVYDFFFQKMKSFGKKRLLMLVKKLVPMATNHNT